MRATYDLLQRPWVPCIGADGRPVELGLREALVSAHELRELHGESPLVVAALYRLLLAVLHRVFGPASYDEWGTLWRTGHWDAARLDAYLGKWQHRFDLFDAQRPFYQAADERVKPKSVASLIHDVASGNNATLFDHHIDGAGLALLPPQAARILVAAQAFGLAGLSGLKQKFTDGTCARGVIFLAQGDNLFETLALNLIAYPALDTMNVIKSPPDANDRPAWETDDPFTPERSVPRGYLDYLTWQNRRILLIPESGDHGPVVREVTLAPALRLAPSVFDPMKHYRRDKKRGFIPLRFTESRALWRDSAALFRLDGKDVWPPQAFHWLSQLVKEQALDTSRPWRFLALGMANNQAKVNFYRSERMPLPLRYLMEKDLLEKLQLALHMAEAAARQLWGATRTLARFVLAPGADAEGAHQPTPEDLSNLARQWAVDRRYWSRLEQLFRHMMVSLPTDWIRALVTWRKTLLRTAWDAFEQVAGNLEFDPRHLKATVRARGQLGHGLKEVLPKVDLSQTS